jgi:hypothetical protein
MIKLGKRSQQKMTGLPLDQRIKRSEKRRTKEAEERLPQLEEPERKHVHELPMPAISPIMRQLVQLEKQLEKEKREKKKTDWATTHDF